MTNAQDKIAAEALIEEARLMAQRVEDWGTQYAPGAEQAIHSDEDIVAMLRLLATLIEEIVKQ